MFTVIKMNLHELLGTVYLFIYHRVFLSCVCFVIRSSGKHGCFSLPPGKSVTATTTQVKKKWENPLISALINAQCSELDCGTCVYRQTTQND